MAAPTIAHDLEARLATSRRGFGRMLHRWRSRYGWSSKTAGLWAKASPEVLPFQVSSATWTSFENDKSRAPAPETFIALELMNAAMASGRVGLIRDTVLRERVKSAEPIRHSNGDPWVAGDFFRCYVGELPVPAELDAPSYDCQAAADQFRRELTDAAQEAQVGVLAAALAVARTAARLTPRQEQALDAVVGTASPFPDADTADTCLAALALWRSSGGAA